LDIAALGEDACWC